MHTPFDAIEIEAKKTIFLFQDLFLFKMEMKMKTSIQPAAKSQQQTKKKQTNRQTHGKDGHIESTATEDHIDKIRGC